MTWTRYLPCSRKGGPQLHSKAVQMQNPEAPERIYHTATKYSMLDPTLRIG